MHFTSGFVLTFYVPTVTEKPEDEIDRTHTHTYTLTHTGASTTTTKFFEVPHIRTCKLS